MSLKAALSLCLGLPGSGKSTLLKRLSVWQRDVENNLENVSESNVNKSHRTHHISVACMKYDEIVNIGDQPRLVKEGVWKHYRMSILKAFESFLCQKMYALSQPESLSELDVKIYQRISEHIPDSLLTGGKCVVFVIEDNFYYQSMRYQWYQLARKFGMGFCQIYIECSVEAALERNAARSCQVENIVIQNVAERMEKPDTVKNSWEAYTLILSENWGDNSLEDCFGLFKISLNNPAVPLQVDEANLELSRLETANSLIHQLDQVLRKIVGIMIRELRNCGSINLQAISKELNEARKRLLSKMKENKLEIPNGVITMLKNTDREKNLDEVANRYLQDCLRAEIKNICELERMSKQ